MFEVTMDDLRLEKAVDFMTRGLESGALKPIVGKVFDFADVADA